MSELIEAIRILNQDAPTLTRDELIARISFINYLARDENYHYQYGTRTKSGVELNASTERIGTEYLNEDGTTAYRTGLVMRPEIYGEVLIRRMVSEWEDMLPEDIEEAIEKRNVKTSELVGHP